MTGRILLLASLCLLGCTAIAQEHASPPTAATPITLGQSVVALTGPWKFHVGDDPRWADPTFDDSTWEPYELAPGFEKLTPEQTLDMQDLPGWQHHGHPGYTGYGWYRLRLNLESTSMPLALLMPSHVQDAYEVYLNGRRIGTCGRLDGVHLSYDPQAALFLIPGDLLHRSGPATLAVRIWSMPWEALPQGRTEFGGLLGVPLIGPSSLLQVFYRSAPRQLPDGWSIQESLYGYPVQPSLYIGIGLLSIFLFLFSRQQREYLWAGIALIGRGLLIAAIYLEEARQLPFQVGEFVQQVAVCISVFSMPLAAMYLLSVPRPRWRRANAFVLGLFAAATLSELGITYGWLPVNPAVAGIDAVLNWIPRTTLGILLLLIAIDGVSAIGRKAWPLMTPGILYAGHMVLYMFVTEGFYGLRGSIDTILSAGVPVSVLFIFLIRFTQQQRENGRMLADMLQAREVQRVMIPAQLPQMPAIAVDCEYTPAHEVGGDFFQIIPHPSDGSLLIVAGDVAGKGLQAGMLVAMLIGALRTEFDHTADPVEILRTLNATLCGREHAQATCLALRVDADGSATLANAGHLPPYRNGRLLEIDGALPLGLAEAAEFSVLRFRLSENDRLVIISDGVVEARNASGELLGFERTAELMAQSAAEIARAAQRWGQEDDITVLTLQYAPAEVLHA